MAGQLGDMDYLWYGGATSDTPMRDCRACGGTGLCIECCGLGYDADDMGQPCEACDGTCVCSTCDGECEEVYEREDYP